MTAKAVATRAEALILRGFSHIPHKTDQTGAYGPSKILLPGQKCPDRQIVSKTKPQYVIFINTKTKKLI